MSQSEIKNLEPNEKSKDKKLELTPEQQREQSIRGLKLDVGQIPHVIDYYQKEIPKVEELLAVDEKELGDIKKFQEEYNSGQHNETDFFRLFYYATILENKPFEIQKLKERIEKSKQELQRLLELLPEKQKQLADLEGGQA